MEAPGSISTRGSLLSFADVTRGRLCMLLPVQQDVFCREGYICTLDFLHWCFHVLIFDALNFHPVDM